MKKLCLFLYSMGPGGAERVVSNLLPYLKENFEVHLVLMSNVIAYPIPSEVKLHFIENSNPYENKIKKLFRLFFALPMLAFKFKKLCLQLNIDTYFVLMNRPCYIALLARILGLKGRMVISERSCPSVIYKNGVSGFFNRVFMKILYPKADLILANAKGNADDLIQNFGCDKAKTKVLYNALNLDEIKKAQNEPLESEFRPFFINIGRLDSGKNQAMLIRAIASINDKRATLGILGKGGLKNELANLIKELNVSKRVRLLGTDKNPFKHIKNASCLLCASRFEGFSNVLIEALACEKTIITTEHKSGAKELIGDDEYGILVPVDDEDAMQKAMIKVLNEPEMRAKFEAKAYQKAKEFDSRNIANELMSYL
ncbi:glycosyltransferase [Campylobacter sp. RM9344]|uniref:Glycosyltransferase n=1 Tax=Campylobacter californiensis TaxID=1032243 RepID=A0AAW3ZYD5_9BACT|nr:MULTISPECIES: glycosyltransferase [unclassified Campylobacter]MBE2985236.1 glycosyltransferase [Campylobacter sp. RM6883]MBE2995678.1 glycosyltransferase [Campylobacter sp. RM6913]MBE3029743.1 glycosyltransferase [Campylobacter sp. RM9344]MBE3606837.1 glycosyltransferase [Campylobacter sp. RM13119]MBE3608673.1 glycosyltransferase [Campylobacter sp. RM9337]